MTKLYIDTETRSGTNLKKQGIARYVQDPRFKVLMATWAVEDEDPRVWLPEEKTIPLRLKKHLEDPNTTIVIANSAFDRRVINASPDFPLTIGTARIVDTMIQALSHNLPGGLDDQSQLFGQEDERKFDGHQLIRLFCVPNKHDEFNQPEDYPEQWQAFIEYAKQDITSMRVVHKKIPRMNYPRQEHSLWRLDQKIADRGLPVDVELAEAAMEEHAREKEELNKRTDTITNGDVKAATQRDKLIKHVAEKYNMVLPNLQAATIDRWLNMYELPRDLRSLLELRSQSSLTAAAKYKVILDRHVDGKLHDTLQFCGASTTGRDSSRAFQPQNLMRPTRWGKLDGAELDQAIQTDIDLIKSGTAGLFDDNVMDLLGNCVRSVIQAPEGYKIVDSDLSNIEGRSLVWLAGEDWKLNFFRRFDQGVEPNDNYEMAYARALNVPVGSVGKYERQIGKVMELGLGFGGGVAAFLNFANIYGLDIPQLAKSVWEIADKALIDQCADKYEWAKENGFHGGMEKFEYAACEYLKTTWRMAHPHTVRMWKELEMAFRNCIDHNNTPFTVGEHLVFKRKNYFLYIRLPSGRFLCYLQPRVEKNGDITYVGRDSYAKRIVRKPVYSGNLAENVTSGTARDVLLKRMPDVEAAGYKTVIRVHDELVTVAPDTPDYSAEHLAEIMSTNFDWCEGLPLAADGFEAYRYRKD